MAHSGAWDGDATFHDGNARSLVAACVEQRREAEHPAALSQYGTQGGWLAHAAEEGCRTAVATSPWRQ